MVYDNIQKNMSLHTKNIVLHSIISKHENYTKLYRYTELYAYFNICQLNVFYSTHVDHCW